MTKLKRKKLVSHEEVRKEQIDGEWCCERGGRISESGVRGVVFHTLVQYVQYGHYSKSYRYSLKPLTLFLLQCYSISILRHLFKDSSLSLPPFTLY